MKESSVPEEDPEIKELTEKPRLEANDVLLRRLLSDATFLKAPRSEKKIQGELGVRLSSLREAIIAFVRSGWLKRTEKGVTRDILDSWSLVELFGFRLKIERTALRQAMINDEVRTAQIEGALRPIVERQRQLLHGQSVDDAVDWFQKSVEFHVSLVRTAGFVESSRILETILWRVRIGACFPLETLDIRETATREHDEIIKGLRDADDGNEERFILQHIREPMARALTQLKAVKDKDDSEVERHWKRVLQIFSAT